MSSKQKVLLQIDSDPQASSFDRIVAIDAGADVVLAHGSVTDDQIESLVHGAMFTRGPKDLHRTAIFVGGSQVAAGERMLAKIRKTFFGPLSVSVMMDANGANTTAAAAVLTADKHLDLSATKALVLGGTGPVGQRVARLLAGCGTSVRLASRSLDRASAAAKQINEAIKSRKVSGCNSSEVDSLAKGIDGVELVISAGAAGIELLSADMRATNSSLKLLIDLNAVPPSGIEGVDMMDKAQDRAGVLTYGAIGVGGMKMKIHKAAIAQLFESNDQILDAETIYDLGKSIMA
jgi:hypothetical protein